MGPGFESQRDHKAPTQVGAFFMRGRERKQRSWKFKKIDCDNSLLLKAGKHLN